MNSLAEQIQHGGGLTIINLGCIGDLDWDLQAEIKRVTTLVEIDALGASRNASSDYQRLIKLSEKVVGWEAGKRTFRENRFVGCSSLLEPKDELVSDFGIQRYYDLKHRSVVECQTIAQIRQEHSIDSISCLKMDLEGADALVLRSCESFLDRIGIIQAELRFKPMYEGEPFIHETMAWLHANGFELVTLNVEYWKYHTPRRFWQSRGNAVFADCIFRNIRAPVSMLGQQILILKMLGLENTAEHLLV